MIFFRLKGIKVKERELMHDAIVVSAGPAGLAAGIQLALFGLNTLRATVLQLQFKHAYTSVTHQIRRSFLFIGLNLRRLIKIH